MNSGKWLLKCFVEDASTTLYTCPQDYDINAELMIANAQQNSANYIALKLSKHFKVMWL